jgi:hypothetical protein
MWHFKYGKKLLYEKTKNEEKKNMYIIGTKQLIENLKE